MEDTKTVYSMAQSATEDGMEMYTSPLAEALADYVASEAQKTSKTHGSCRHSAIVSQDFSRRLL
jgi:hypothetical protein